LPFGDPDLPKMQEPTAEKPGVLELFFFSFLFSSRIRDGLSARNPLEGK